MLLCWCLGCAGPEQTSDAGTDGDDDRTDGLPPVEHIEIPMRPRDEVELYGLPEIIETDSGARMELGVRIDLAIGSGYPETLELTLPEAWWATCGSGVGAMELDTISGSGGPVTAQRIDAQTIRLETKASGSAAFVGRGTLELDADACELQAGTVLELELTLSVVAHDAVDGRIAMPCVSEQPVALAPSSGPAGQWFSAELLDAYGEPYVAANADPDAQLGVELHGEFDADHASPTSLRTWIAPSRPGRVEIVPALGESVAVDVVRAERIVAAPVEFQLAGTASGPLTLVEGERYGDEGWGRAANRIAPMLVEPARTDAGPLCSDPWSDWFRLESLTPSVCTVVDLPVSPDKGDGYTLFGSRLGQAARLQRAGTCSLQLHAPGFAPAAGFPHAFTADFADPTGLHEL